MRRLPELDMMRAVAIIFIVYFHVSMYLYDNSLTVYIKPFMNYLAYLGIGSFSFLSGFLLYERAPAPGVIEFYKKRLVRIYPLYLAAIAIAWFTWDVMQIGIFSAHYTVSDILIQLFCLQEILKPVVTINEIPSLWFISALMIYYFVYPFIVAQKWAKEMILAASTILLAFLLLRIWFGIFFFRVFLYFVPFMAGIIFNHLHIYNRFQQRSAFIAGAAFVVTSEVFLLRMPPFEYRMPMMNEYFFYFFIDAMIISYCYLFYFSVRGICFNAIILNISISSYIVFLIHMPIIDLLMQNLRLYGRDLYVVFMICFIAIPLMIALSYWIQIEEIRFREWASLKMSLFSRTN